MDRKQRGVRQERAVGFSPSHVSRPRVSSYEEAKSIGGSKEYAFKLNAESAFCFSIHQNHDFHFLLSLQSSSSFLDNNLASYFVEKIEKNQHATLPFHTANLQPHLGRKHCLSSLLFHPRPTLGLIPCPYSKTFRLHHIVSFLHHQLFFLIVYFHQHENIP